MQVLEGEVIELMTGYKQPEKQKEWFQSRGYICKQDPNGNVWTCDIWMNKLFEGLHLQHDANGPMTLNEWLAEYARLFIFAPSDLPDTPESVGEEERSGVYFLFLNDQIVYIGKSKQFETRLQQHRKDGRRFDSYRIIEGIPLEQLEHIEMFYINKYQPPGNLKAKPCHPALLKFMEAI